MTPIHRRIARRLYWEFHALFARIVNSAAKRGIPLTRNNWKIRKLKDKHRGERCFIVGNGPSLCPEDLDKLKNEITFASNKIYKIFGKTSWRPTYYMAVDDVVVKQNHADINAMQGPTKFTLHHLRHFLDADIYFNNNLGKKNGGVFSDNSMHSLYSSGSVSYHMLQIAFYMGFTKVYLIGHDYNFKGAVSRSCDLTKLLPEESPIYFSNDYVKQGETPAGQAPDEMYYGMEKAKLAYECAGRHIYNATRTSYLDVFEKKNLDDACTS